MGKTYEEKRIIDPLGPQAQPVVIIIYSHVFQTIPKQNKRLEKIMIATDGTVGLAEGIIDDPHVL